MDQLYSTLLIYQPLKLIFNTSHVHPSTHSSADGRSCHAGCRAAHQEQGFLYQTTCLCSPRLTHTHTCSLEFSVLPKDTLIKPLSLWLVDNWPSLQNHIRPDIRSSVSLCLVPSPRSHAQCGITTVSSPLVTGR